MQIVVLVGTFFSTDLLCFRMNLLNPHDTLIRPSYNKKYANQLSVFFQGGIGNAHVFNAHADRVNVLQVWQSEQNSLAMLNGFSPETPIAQLRARLDAGDDGVRGHFAVNADLKTQIAFAFGGRFGCSQDFSVNSYLPVYRVLLHNVIFTDKTGDVTPQDVRVKQFLTDNLAENVLELGNLDIGPWTRAGCGDWRTDLIWYHDFVQEKPFLKNVGIEWRVGLSIPTGLCTDEDKLFAQSFGYDGAWAVPFGFGLTARLGKYIQVGLDIELVHLFGNTRYRRIKTSEDQTDFLLLQKASAYKDFGMNQQFNLFVQLYKVAELFSCTVGYQYFKHGDDELALKTNSFSTAIANSVHSLDYWTMHHIVINAEYDCTAQLPSNTPVSVQCSLFGKIPFNGKGVALTNSLGTAISVDF